MASSSEPSVQKCVNRTRDFFVHGVRPLRGLDEVSRLVVGLWSRPVKLLVSL